MSSFAQHVMFIVMLVIQNQRFINQVPFGVPLQPYDGCILLTIKGKWLEAIVHMIEFEFLNLAHLKQVQLLISICVCSKFQLLPTSTLVGFQKTIQKFILKT
jgi:hypothetical protein